MTWNLDHRDEKVIGMEMFIRWQGYQRKAKTSQKSDRWVWSREQYLCAYVSRAAFVVTVSDISLSVAVAASNKLALHLSRHFWGWNTSEGEKSPKGIGDWGWAPVEEAGGRPLSGSFWSTPDQILTHRTGWAISNQTWTRNYDRKITRQVKHIRRQLIDKHSRWIFKFTIGNNLESNLLY